MAEGIFGGDVTSAQPPLDEENIFEPVEMDYEEGQGGAEEELEGPDEGEPTPAVEEPAKEQKILNKFNDIDAVADGYINLMGKLGQDPGVFDTEDDLIEAYKSAEKQLHSKKPADNQATSQAPSQEPLTGPQASNEQLQQMQQQLQYQQQQLQQYAAYYQYMQAMQGQQAQQQGQQSNQAAGQSEEKMDPQEWLDKFYENPTEAIEQQVQRRIDSVLPQYQQQIQQQIQPVAQHYQQQQMLDGWERQVTEMKKQLPDFDDLSKDMEQEFQTDPQLLQYLQRDPQMGMSVALREAYNRVKGRRLQQQGQQYQQTQQQQAQLQTQLSKQNQAEKQAARIQVGGAKRVLRQPTAEDVEIAMIFGDQKTKQGIFG